MPQTSLETEADLGRLGPAMSALNPRQRAFVDALLTTGRNNFKECAKIAGYTGNDNTLAVTGHRLAHDDGVRAAIREESERRLEASVGFAVSTLVNIIEETTDKKIKLKAIGMLLNRAGLPEKTEHTVKVEDNREARATFEATARRLSEKFGVALDQLLGASAPVKQLAPPIDAEYVEVGSTEGLEDVL